MKVEWHEDDIWCGRLIRKPDVGVTGLHQIGYRHSLHLASGRTEQVYVLNSLADGQAMDAGFTKLEVAEHLNRCGYYVPIELTDGLPEDFNAK
jgi:hypothetical protein